MPVLPPCKAQTCDVLLKDCLRVFSDLDCLCGGVQFWLQVLTELAGTMGYIAPEVLQRCYTEQADVWSTGVMLYEMVCGKLPYSLGNTCEEVSRRHVWAICSMQSQVANTR